MKSLTDEEIHALYKQLLPKLMGRRMSSSSAFRLIAHAVLDAITKKEPK
ncbi:MAG: hypothetical protein KGL63_11540 [Betaproteobacteria bacterium]|nr:hypothetical protein [Betaproteobacteria bacterium]